MFIDTIMKNTDNIPTSSMKRKLILLTLFLGLLSCNQDDEDCKLISKVPVTKVNSSVNGKVNESITIEVTVSLPNPCTPFDGFQETVDGKSLTIRAISSLPCKSDETACIQIVSSIDVVYEFIAEEPGEYTLNFISYNEEVNTVEVTVE